METREAAEKKEASKGVYMHGEKKSKGQER